MAALGPGLTSTYIAIAILAVPNFVRMTRSTLIEVKQRDFVFAAKVLGAKDNLLVGRHLVPNCGL